MPKASKELARRPAAAALAAGPKPRIVYTHGEHAPEYTLSQTLLGEFAMHWNADNLAGRFCITEFPAEWVAYIQSAFRGAWREGTYDGTDAKFAVVAWDLSDWERTVGPFSELPLRTWLPRNPLWAMLDTESALHALHPRHPHRGFRRTLALPEAGAGHA